ncbi:MAG: hypothetical protein HYU67_05785 [Flavobacteriia bacterium]|nr:hypothetical protein [Flavobacteriia bacterium]
MKKTHLFILIGLCTLTLSCKKESENEPTNNNPTPTPSGFTPPTTNYWKISGEVNNSSADAFSVNIAATSASLSKPFNTYSYSQINIARNDGYSNEEVYREIRSKVAEGGYKEISLTTKKSLGYTPNGDSLSINVTLQENGAYYYFICQGGKIYVSKKNNKLRFTTKGAINMTGVVYTNLENFAFTKTVDFSWEEQ